MKLEDYGFIGNMRTCALVGANGSMDWLCLPRFDSSACLASRLGEEKNGCWRIAPRDGNGKGRQRYRPDTMILETEFETESGTVRVIDCMPPHAKFREVVRIVEGVSGAVEMAMRF